MGATSAGFQALLKRIDKEVFERGASAAKKRLDKEGRYLLGSAFGSWQGLAGDIIKKGSTDAPKYFARRTKPVKDALQGWGKAQADLFNSMRSEASRKSTDRLAYAAQDAEQGLVKALRRNGLERTRTAQLLQRMKNLASVNDPGGRGLRSGMRVAGGSIEMRSLPGSARLLRNRFQGRGEFSMTEPHAGSAASYRRGTDEAPGRINITPTRSAGVDAEIAAHEGLGHGVLDVERRAAGLDEVDDFYDPKSVTSEFREAIGDVDAQTPNVPYRQPWSPSQVALSQHRAQQRGGQTLDPGWMDEAQARMKAGRRGPGGPEGDELARAMLGSEPHGEEEQFADLMANLLDPQARKKLPLQVKVSLAKQFPSAFPELVETGVKMRNWESLRGLRRGR